MGMVRRRTRRRTAMVVGGMAYASGGGAAARKREQEATRSIGGSAPRPPAPGAQRRRCGRRARTPGVIAHLWRALRRGVRRRQAEGSRRIARRRPGTGVLMTEHPRGATLRRAIEIFISPDDGALSKLGDLFIDDVTVWTPNMLAVGLSGLKENLSYP